MDGLLVGKTAVITGANRGIGHEIVKAFAAEKCNVWACARTKNNEFEKELEKISENNQVVIRPLYFDICNEKEMREAIKVIQQSKMAIDILVNCAGILHIAPFQMTKADDLRNVFETNFFAPVELTRLVTKLMIRHKKGSIINLASQAGLDPHPANSAYGSAKAALIMFTQVLASEVAELGIRVNAIAPGNTDTDMILPVIEKAGEDSMYDITAMGRFAKPEEIADVAVFLASDKSSFINGEVIRVDGGRK